MLRHLLDSSYLDNYMKKILTALILLPTFTFANTGGNSSPGLKVGFSNPFGSIDSIEELIVQIVDLFINFGAIIVVFFIIYAGFKFVIARGNPTKIEEAKKILLWTLVGAVILLGAKVIAAVIQSTLSEFTG